MKKYVFSIFFLFLVFLGSCKHVPVENNNADLSSLTVSEGLLSPGFASGVTDYSVAVVYDVAVITVTGTAGDSSATVGGQSGAPVALAVGPNTIKITVTAADGTTQKTYTVTVTRGAENANANLSTLTVNQGALSPTFSAYTTSYTVSVVNAVSSITITGTADDSSATVGGQSGIEVVLAVGSNAIGIVVTAADGTTQKTYTVTVTRSGPGKIINHTNFDPSGFTDAQVLAAAALKVYFEHASTGTDIVGNSETNSSAGLDYADDDSCGLALLYASDNRYRCDRTYYEDYETPGGTWFATHGGLMNWRRNNPPPATKLSMFLDIASAIRANADVIMYKYCWIDVHSDESGYISNGATWAASEISQRETYEANNPGLIMPYWTMPLQSNAGYAARDAYNEAIRTYCEANGKWLLDMADIENYTAAGVKVSDVGGGDAASSSYTETDGGHLNTTGALRLAKAYWRLLAEIAQSD